MTAPPQDFCRWLSEARGGSPDALGKAFEGCRRYLLGVAQHELNRDLQAKGGASDLVQETFLEAHRAFDRFEGTSEGELRAWLRQLLRHRATKLRTRYRTTQKRRLARETALTAASLPAGWKEAVPSPSDLLMAHEQAQRLRQALERLSDDHRGVITLRYLEQCSFEEIGRRMQRTANAARLLWLRAIERIKYELRDADDPG